MIQLVYVQTAKKLLLIIRQVINVCVIQINFTPLIKLKIVKIAQTNVQNAIIPAIVYHVI
jgi:hypothetical protein